MGYIDKVSVNGTEYDVLDSSTRSIINNALTMKTVGELAHAEKTVAAPIGDIVIYGRSAQTATPTPSAPVAVNIAGNGGTLKVTSGGKNLWPFHTNSSATAKGITFVRNSDGSVTVSGTSTGTSADWTIKNFVTAGNLNAFGPGTYNVSGAVSPVKLMIGIQHLDGSSATYVFDTGSGASFTLGAGECIRSLTIRVSDSGTTVNDVVLYPMLVKSDTAAYEPFAASVYPVTVPETGLPGIAVSSGGNYTDSTGQQWVCDTIDLGKGVYTQRVQTVVLDGTEFWKVENTGTANWYYLCDYRAHLPEGTKLQDVVLSSHYPYALVSNQNTLNGIGVGNNGGYGYVRIRYGTEDTAQNFKTWLTSNNVTVVYQKYTPVEIPLTDTQLSQLRAISTIDGDTWLYNDGGSGMKVRFFADLSALLAE